VTLKIEVMASKNSALPSQEELTFLNILQKPVHFKFY